MRRVFQFERKLLFAGMAYLLLATLLIVLAQSTDWISPTVAIVLGISANLLTSVLLYFATNLEGGADDEAARDSRPAA